MKPYCTLLHESIRQTLLEDSYEVMGDEQERDRGRDRETEGERERKQKKEIPSTFLVKFSV